MDDDGLLEKEREVTALLLEGLEKLLAQVVAQQVVIEDLMPGRTAELVLALEIDLMQAVHKAVAEQFDVIRGNDLSTSPSIDWRQMVCDLVESSRDIELPPQT